jgi:hypothetical protein
MYEHQRLLYELTYKVVVDSTSHVKLNNYEKGYQKVCHFFVE